MLELPSDYSKYPQAWRIYRYVAMFLGRRSLRRFWPWDYLAQPGKLESWFSGNGAEQNGGKKQNFKVFCFISCALLLLLFPPTPCVLRHLHIGIQCVFTLKLVRKAGISEALLSCWLCSLCGKITLHVLVTMLMDQNSHTLKTILLRAWQGVSTTVNLPNLLRFNSQQLNAVWVIKNRRGTERCRIVSKSANVRWVHTICGELL